jgi:hypothetical protein
MDIDNELRSIIYRIIRTYKAIQLVVFNLGAGKKYELVGCRAWLS